MTAKQILADIHSLEVELLAFERKYGIRSEVFYTAFMGGDEPENDAWTLDFGEWASVYRVAFREVSWEGRFDVTVLRWRRALVFAGIIWLDPSAAIGF